MTALSTLISRARIRTGTTTARSNRFSDADLVDLSYAIYAECQAAMVEIQSNLVYKIGTIIASEDTMETSISSALGLDSLMIEGVIIDGETNFLVEGLESDKEQYDISNVTGQPERYFLTEADTIGFLPVPDDDYTVRLYYLVVPPSTLTTGTDLWGTYWDTYIQKRLEYEINYILEKDTAQLMLEIEGAKTDALLRIRNLGTALKNRRQRSDFFTAEGV